METRFAYAADSGVCALCRRALVEVDATYVHAEDVGFAGVARFCSLRCARLDREYGPLPNMSGMRFVLTRDVERYPFFIAKAGSVGTVIDDSAEIWATIALKLDDPPRYSEEWEGRVEWYADGDGGGDIGVRHAFLADARPLLDGDAIAREVV